MLPSKFATPLALERSPSYQVIAFLACLHLIAVLAVLSLELHAWVKAALFIAVICNAAWCLYVHSSFSASFVYRLVWDEVQWRLFDRALGEYSAQLNQNVCITPLFIILEFLTSTGKKQSVFIARDSLGREAYRKLSIRLNHTVVHEEAQNQ